ncbi:hypothetical protein HDU97_002668 [Phlyctochytrium planicorne]|nr:hypothetical protein HDU97_002668 [Phlyctochytrium planicorne]
MDEDEAFARRLQEQFDREIEEYNAGRPLIDLTIPKTSAPATTTATSASISMNRAKPTTTNPNSLIILDKDNDVDEPSNTTKPHQPLTTDTSTPPWDLDKEPDEPTWQLDACLDDDAYARMLQEDADAELALDLKKMDGGGPGVDDPMPDLHALFMNFDEQVLFGEAIRAFAQIPSQIGLHQYALARNDGHGKPFLEIAKRINQSEGTNITVYHNFRDEVDHYRTHVWKCQGPCGRLLKRAMNRQPRPSDWWFADHLAKCGGEYVKISSPPPTEKPKKPKAAKGKGKEKEDEVSNGKGVKRKQEDESSGSTSKRKPKKADSINDPSKEASEETQDGSSSTITNLFKDYKRGGIGIPKKIHQHLVDEPIVKTKAFNLFNVLSFDPDAEDAGGEAAQKIVNGDEGAVRADARIPQNGGNKIKVECPVCGKQVEEDEINGHLDKCLS